MSGFHTRTMPRITRARGYLPRPSIRRSWPDVARMYGVKRTLTGVSFEGAEARMRSYPTLLSSLTAQQRAALAELDDPWAPDEHVRDDPRAA